MKFAYLILGPDFHPEQDRAAIHQGDARIIGVSSVEEACKQARALAEAGIGCIELCGAFGPEGAARVVSAVENRGPVGYAVHLPIQDALFSRVFGE